MLLEQDPWFIQAHDKARKAEKLSSFSEAERLYRLIYEETVQRGEAETTRESRLTWIHSLIRISNFNEAKDEAEGFLAELGDTDPRVRARLNMHLAAIAYYQNDYEKVINISNRLLSSPVLDQLPDIKSTAYNQLAIAERHLGLYNKAVEHLEEALLLVRENKLPDTGSYDSNLAFIYMDQGRYSQALNSFQASLGKAKKTGQEDAVLYSMMGIGGILKATGKYKDAEAQFHKTLRKAHKMEKTHLVPVALIELGSLAREQGRLSEAAEDVQTALDSARQAGLREMEAEALMARAWISCDKAEGLDSAMADAEIAFNIHKELGVEYGLMSALTLKAALACKMEKNAEALQAIEEAIALCEADAGSHIELEKETYFNAWRVFDALGQKERASQMAERARQIISRTAQILSPEDRVSFLTRPINRDILNKLPD